MENLIMIKKYYVRIIASNQLNLLKLRTYDLDLFKPSAKKSTNNEFTIDGFLTMEEIEKLVEDRYKLSILGDPDKSFKARSDIITFQDWIKDKRDKKKSIKKKKLTENIDDEVGGGYLTADGIESAIQHLAKEYPSICKTILLDKNKTHEGRICRVLKISGNITENIHKNGILLIGGVHAREIVNPDLLVKFSYDLCLAYISKTGLTYGDKSFDIDDIQKVVNELDIYVFPLVNPDGRIIVQTRNAMWRKNNNPNSNSGCRGVDINRNYDFLWNSGIGTSLNECSDTFRGANAFSEPETRNVLQIIDEYSNIKSMIDVHSFSETILYPWGDDNNQTLDPYMNFMNPVYDGLRGNLDDSEYQEYIIQSDLEWFEKTGNKMKDSIESVNGTEYKVEQSIGLYPTTGTSDNYIYSRHLGTPTERKIFAYTIETGKSQGGDNPFDMPYSEAIKVIPEVSAGLIQFCLASISLKEEIGITSIK
jgi:carboxypeptidase T